MYRRKLHPRRDIFGRPVIYSSFVVFDDDNTYLLPVKSAKKSEKYLEENNYRFLHDENGERSIYPCLLVRKDGEPFLVPVRLTPDFDM